MTTKEAYTIGRSVTVLRMMGRTQAQLEHLTSQVQCFGTSESLGAAYWLGRDRFARTGTF